MGALIAVSFISGAILSVDGISSNFFQEKLDKMDYHFMIDESYDYIQGPEVNVDGWAKKLSDLPEVKEARGNIRSSIIFSNYSLEVKTYLWGMNEDSANYYFDEQIPLPVEAGSVIISSDLAKTLNVKRDDTFRLNYFTNSWAEGDQKEGEVTFSVFDIRDLRIAGDERMYQSEQYYEYDLVVSVQGFRAFINATFDETERNNYAFFKQEIEVKIDPSSLKNLDDPNAMRADIKRLEKKIDTALRGSDYSVSYENIEGQYVDYQFMSWFMRIFFVILSIPLLLISFYLLSAGSKVGMDERIREIGLLKIKGASNGQVIGILFLESLIYGIAGGGLGLIAGTILSSFFTAHVSGVRPFDDLFGNGISLPGLPLMILAFVVVPTIILIMRIGAIVKLSKVPLLEALGRATIIDKQKNYKLTRDLLVLSFTLTIIGLMLYFNNNTPNNFYTRLVYFLLVFFSPLTILFLPFLLILTISRILILGFDFTLNFLSNIGKLLIDDLYPVVKANLKFQRKRIATMTILVTAVIAFGILISTLDASREEKVVRDVSSSIPTDMAIVTTGTSGTMLSNLTSMREIDDVVEIGVFYGMQIILTDGGYIDSRIVYFDSERYLNVVNVPKNVREEGDGPNALKGGIEVPILINEAFNYRNGHIPGDTLDLYYGDLEFSVKIVGIVSYLPGTRSTFDERIYNDYGYDLFDDLSEEPAIYIDSSYLPSAITPTYRTFLIDADGSEKAAMSAIEEMDWNGSTHVTLSKAVEVNRIKDDQYFRSIQMILDMEYLFVIVAVTGGVTLFMTVSTASRRREFAELIARGSTRKHVLRLVLTEGAIVLAGSLIIGTFIGILVAYSFQHLFSFDLFQFLPGIMDPSMVRTEIDTGSPIIFPPSLIFLHIFASCAVLGASLFTSWLASKVDVASSLRLRTS